MLKFQRVGLGLGFALLFSGAAASAPDKIYVNGSIATMDDAAPSAEAIAITGSRISAIGKRADLLATKGANTQIVDLKGRVLLPGFIDAHGHFPFSAMLDRTTAALQSPPVGTVKGLDDVLGRLKARAANTRAGEWIQGAGYDDTLLIEKRHPTRHDLDKVSREHPIYLMHVSGHMAAVNSRALELAGITKDTTPPPGGKFRTDTTTGEPNGVLEESAMYAVAKLLPKVSDEDMQAIIMQAGREYASKGVTTAQNGAATADDIRHLESARQKGALPIRVDIWPQFQVRLAAMDQNAALNAAPDQDLIRFTANKGFADGSIQAFTGYLAFPYHSHGHDDANYRGYPRAPRETLTAQVVRLHKAGYQLAVHANGDAAIDDLLFAYAKAQDEALRPDARHIIVHSQMARDDQLDTMKKLGVIPSFFNLHVYYWGDRHRDIFIGPERAGHISPMRAAIDKGLTITLHSDSPVVPIDPLMIVWSAVNRVTSSGAVLGADQKITPEEALRAITLNAAYQAFAEKDKGALAVGKLADMVVLDGNPMTVAPARIKDIAVLETIVGGNTVWTRGAAKTKSDP